MKILSAALSALVVIGFAGAASAQCASYAKPAAEQSAQAPIIVQENSAGS